MNDTTTSPVPAAVADALGALRRQVLAATPRLARLGAWPVAAPADALAVRLPSFDADGAPVDGLGGFDAGVACALDLVPRDRQGLAAKLHAAWSPAAVAQLRRETADLADPDLPAAWWLAACSVCVEGPVGPDRFLAQLDEFDVLVADPDARLAAALGCLDAMRAAFEVRDGVAWASRDGGAQGAYLAGHDLTVTWAERYGLFFVGTFWPSLGLRGFAWRAPGDLSAQDPAARQGRSGPVGGSAQFVKCCDRDELAEVLEVASAHLDAMPGLDAVLAPTV